MSALWDDLRSFIELELHHLFPPKPLVVPGGLFTYTAVEELMLHYNNALPMFGISPVWTNPIRGSTIHKIGATSAAIATGALYLAVMPKQDYLTYYLACGAIESAFDDQAENKNLGPGGSNPKNTPGGYDEGWAQLKLRYINTLPNSSMDAAMAFARDPKQAIPYFVKRYNDLLAWADVAITTLTPDVEPAYRNRFYLATTAYAKGVAGSHALLAARNHHADTVAQLEAQFAKQLGRTPLMGD